MTGYSDRVNHALAFAAKHHDQEVRRGTRAPYFAQPANVGIVLTRYARGEDEVTAGVLYDVVDDYVRAGYSRETLQQRVAEKFGSDVLDTLLSITPRRVSDAGVDLTSEERRRDVLGKLDRASEQARWVLAAHELHDAATLLTDLNRTVDPGALWRRRSGGRRATLAWYDALVARFRAVGFDAPVVDELADVVTRLEHHVQGEAQPSDVPG